ncbi:MAG: ABC transporter permease [Chloroflexi bacterium]|jgi:ABC-2 type transport system permease protein|nr:ABC transporter permease [Chloroflexota bacterium]
MIRRIYSLIVKEFIHLRNDWWMPAFMLFGGALELLLVGWATSRPMSNLPLMVWDQDKSPASRLIVIALENTGTFVLEDQVEGMDAIEYALDRGNITAAIIIPPDYADEVASNNGQPSLAVILNGAESIPAREALRAIEGVTRQLGEQITIERLGLDPGTFAGFDFSLRVWFNEALSEALYTTPAELGLMLEFTVLLFAALSFSRERELGTLEQLLVMPFSSLEIIIGKAIPVILVGFFDFVLMLTMVHFAFDVPIRGSLPLLLILAFGYLMVELSKGMIVSVMSHTQHQAFLLVMLLGMTDFMFTGYAAPVEGMPKAAQLFANLVPAHHWLEILRGILLKGSGLDVLWPHVLALAILGTIIGGFSLRYVRRALD